MKRKNLNLQIWDPLHTASLRIINFRGRFFLGTLRSSTQRTPYIRMLKEFKELVPYLLVHDDIQNKKNEEKEFKGMSTYGTNWCLMISEIKKN